MLLGSGLLYSPVESCQPMSSPVKLGDSFVLQSIDSIKKILTDLSSEAQEISRRKLIDMKSELFHLVENIIDGKFKSVSNASTRPKTGNFCKSNWKINSRVCVSYPDIKLDKSNLKRENSYLKTCSEVPFRSSSTQVVSSFRNLFVRKRCYYCRKIGHVVAECRSRNRECFRCGSKFHFIADCSLNPKPDISKVTLRSDKNIQCDIRSTGLINPEVTVNNTDKINSEISDLDGPTIVNLCDLRKGTLFRFPIKSNDKPDTLIDSDTVTGIMREEILVNCESGFDGGMFSDHEDSCDSKSVRFMNEPVLSICSEDKIKVDLSENENSLSELNNSLAPKNESKFIAKDNEDIHVEQSKDLSDNAHEEWVKDFRRSFPSLAIGLAF